MPVLKDFELHVFHDRCELGQPQIDSQIRLVRAIVLHGLRIGHGGKHLRKLDLKVVRKDLANHLLKQCTNLVLIQKGGFAVDLGEFRLTICSEIFISEHLVI